MVLRLGPILEDFCMALGFAREDGPSFFLLSKCRKLFFAPRGFEWIFAFASFDPPCIDGLLARGSGVVAEEVSEVLVVFELLGDGWFLCAGADACLVADGCVGEGFAGFGVDEVAGGGVEVEAGAEGLFEEGSKGGIAAPAFSDDRVLGEVGGHFC